MTKPLGIACDHAGLEMKRALVTELEERSVVVRDFGTNTGNSCDYPDIAHAVSRAIESGEVECAILACGTGVGMSIAANRHAAVRATVCSESVSARMSRQHNEANVLCIGARHAARVAKINLA
jgi:ribose 5-phosphate isomerase B